MAATGINTKIKTVKRYRCCRCGELLEEEGNFYKVASPLYEALGHLPICKTCFENQFLYFRDMHGNNEKALKRMCMLFDIYYDDTLYNTVKNTGSKMIGNYIKKLNMVSFKTKTFDNSILNGFEFNVLTEEELEELKTKEKRVKQVDINKWGMGFTADDYDVLNSHYKYLKTANPNCDSNQEIFINDLCYTKMMQQRAVRDGKVDDYNKLTESYRKSFQQAGLKTVQDNTTSEDFGFAVNGEIIERTSPAEFYKNQKLYKDYDGLGDYINRMFLRPLKNLMTGSKDEDPEFRVKDEDEAGGYDDE